MRFTNDEVMNHFEEVCEKIQGYCNHSTQTQVQKESEFTLFFQADARQQSVEVLGFLRNYFIKDLDLLAGKENELAFAFVTDFPLYEVDPETGDFASVHHPFTKPKLKDIPFVI
jgi:aspartyl-tRNA synthetase